MNADDAREGLVVIRLHLHRLPMACVTKDQFLAHSYGRKFVDVQRDHPTLFDQIVWFFNDQAIHQRMVDSQLHHDRSPLAGVVAELENESWFDQHMRTNDAHQTERLREAIGVLVMIIMNGYGFTTTGNKDVLGTRAKVPPDTTTAGAFHNEDGVSLWFKYSERYSLAGNPFVSVSERAKSLPKF